MILMIAIGFILLTLPFLIYRAVHGPEWSDRIIAGDLLGLSLAAGLLILKIYGGFGWNRDAIWLIIAISFIGTMGASLLLEEAHHD